MTGPVPAPVPADDHFVRVYRGDAAAYDRLVSAEDHEGNLLAALAGVRPLADALVLDVGTGTGRMARLLAPLVRAVVGLDLHRAMLVEQAGRAPGPLVQADARALPVPSAVFDLTVAGWAVGHARDWFAERWRDEAGAMVHELVRATRPGGQVAVVETLGTAVTEPAAPTPGLAELHRWLEDEHGFSRRVVRTDYRFATADEAAAVMAPFFGPELARTVLAEEWAVVPEWTGLWVRHR